MKGTVPSTGARFVRGGPWEEVPRKPRAEFEAGVWHVYARGNNRQVVHHDERDRRTYVAMLAAEVERHAWRCLSYCLMPNHVHLLVETTQPNLGRGMQRLQGDYARWFNKRHGRSGHLFGERFGATWIGDDAHLWTAARYVARNPVEAGLCEEPGDFAWSSYAATVGGTAPAWLDVDRLLELFGGDPTGGTRQPIDRFATFVAAT